MPFGSLDTMWLAFEALSTSKTPTINSDQLFPLLQFRCQIPRVQRGHQTGKRLVDRHSMPLPKGPGIVTPSTDGDQDPMCA